MKPLKRSKPMVWKREILGRPNISGINQFQRNHVGIDTATAKTAAMMSIQNPTTTSFISHLEFEYQGLGVD